MNEYPKTNEEWWGLVERRWAALLGLIAHFHPASDQKYNRPFPITAEAAEFFCETIREDVIKEVTRNPVELAEEAKQNRDSDALHILFEQTWFGMPESAAVRLEDGFHTLCDLCSEYSECFQEEEV